MHIHRADALHVRAGMPFRLPTLHIRVLDDGAIPVVVLVGEVDLDDVDKLTACLRRLTGTVIVDLAAVTFLGSTGLAAFVTTRKRLREGGGDLLLRSPSDLVRRVLEVTGLDVMVIGRATADGRPTRV